MTFYFFRCKKLPDLKKKKKIKILKKNNKNCMILHCKNAEMTILLSFLHFYSVKSYNFCYFFSPIQICFRLNKKNFFSNFYFYFFPSDDLNILRKKSVNQVLKKIRPYVQIRKEIPIQKFYLRRYIID